LTAIDRVSEILGLGASVAPNDNIMPERTRRELLWGAPKLPHGGGRGRNRCRRSL